MGDVSDVAFNPSPEPDVLHVSFSPSHPYFGNDSPLNRICAARQAEGRVLHRVVAHNQYESVAVFVRAQDAHEVRIEDAYERGFQFGLRAAARARELARQAAAAGRATGSASGLDGGEIPDARRALSRGRKRIPDEQIERAADVYRAALEGPAAKRATATVAAELGISVSAAGVRVKLARERGLLGPSAGTKAGEGGGEGSEVHPHPVRPDLTEVAP